MGVAVLFESEDDFDRVADGARYAGQLRNHPSQGNPQSPVSVSPIIQEVKITGAAYAHPSDGSGTYGTNVYYPGIIQFRDVAAATETWIDGPEILVFELNISPLVNGKRYEGRFHGYAKDGKTVYSAKSGVVTGLGVVCDGPFVTGGGCVGNRLVLTTKYLIVDFARGSIAFGDDCSGAGTPPPLPPPPSSPTGGGGIGNIKGMGGALGDDQSQPPTGTGTGTGGGQAGRPVPGHPGGPSTGPGGG